MQRCARWPAGRHLCPSTLLLGMAGRHLRPCFLSCVCPYKLDLHGDCTECCTGTRSAESKGNDKQKVANAIPAPASGVYERQGSDDNAQVEGGSIREKLVALTGPCVRLSPDLLHFMARLKRLFFLSEGQDLSRWEPHAWLTQL